jgi:hypothetical protein
MMYQFIRNTKDKNRLEQEKIDQQYVNNALKNKKIITNMPLNNSI